MISRFHEKLLIFRIRLNLMVLCLIQKWLIYINLEIQQQNKLDFAVFSFNVEQLDSCTIDLRLILFMFKYKGEKWILYLTAVV